MEEKLRIALVQTSLIWQNIEENRMAFSTILKGISAETDLVILPEMFTTGFTMESEKVAETMNGPTTNWLQNLAETYNVAITGSIVIKEKNDYYNRLLFLQPQDEIHYYDKKHLFTLAKEDQYFSPGKKQLCINYKGWKIKPLVCYDLRFPVWSRNTENYDLLLYVANWPKPRIEAWDVLLQARAIENMCYVAGVNRIGTDNQGHVYIGHSIAYDMLGNALTNKNNEENQIIYATLDKSALNGTRNKLRFLEDRDPFTL